MSTIPYNIHHNRLDIMQWTGKLYLNVSELHIPRTGLTTGVLGRLHHIPINPCHGAIPYTQLALWWLCKPP